jgi:hypothetical protein
VLLSFGWTSSFFFAAASFFTAFSFLGVGLVFSFLIVACHNAGFSEQDELPLKFHQRRLELFVLIRLATRWEQQAIARASSSTASSTEDSSIAQ